MNINTFRWHVISTSALTAFGIGFLAFNGQAMADPFLSASAAYSLAGGSTVTVPNPASPPNDIYPSDSDGTNSIFGHVYSYANGINGSRSSGTNTYSINGTSEYTTTYTNTGSTAAAYYFDFEIAAGELSVSLPGAATGTQSASLSAKILVNGVAAFDYESSMSIATGGSPAFTESGAVLNPSGASATATSDDYFWSAFDASVFLGTLNPGQSVTVDYTLFSSAIGAMTDVGTCSSGGYGGYGGYILASLSYGGGSTSCVSTALARIGDPFNGGGTPVDPPASFGIAAPEPTTLALLGVGLSSLAFARRRRNAKPA